MSRYIQSLLIFVVLLVVLNFFLSEFEYGVHISIVGSVVLTLVVSVLTNALFGGRR
jgi:hypothetical protein